MSNTTHPRDIFRSTAPYYAHYRPTYPAAFFDEIGRRFDLDGRGTLLDLGCGPGQLAVALSSRFERAIGMDPEPEMLEEARRNARAANASIDLIEAGSGDLERLREVIGPLRLVTMSESFHWMDGPATLAALHSMLEPGGGLLIAWLHRTPDAVNGWLSASDAAIKQALGPRRRAGSGFYSQPAESFADLLREAGFAPVAELPDATSPFVFRRNLDVDAILGWLYSTSFASPFVLGDRRAAFEAGLRERLHAISPGGRFVEEWAAGALLAWKRS